MKLRNTVAQADHDFSLDQMKIVDKANRLIQRKIKEALKISNRINKVSYILPEIWFLNLQ